MKACVLPQPAPVESGPLAWREVADPVAGPGEVLIRVRACGVCRTDLHVVEGELPVRRSPVIPGHQIVGQVVAFGPPPDDGATPPGGVAAPALSVGQRVGVAWLHRTCGRCRFCRSGRENLCVDPDFTGWTVDGGFAELCTARADFVYPLPAGFGDLDAAPLLCAGIIGYRALKRAELPPGGRLGVYGFGGSAHLASQVAIASGAAVHVFTRAPSARELALELGAASAQDSFDPSPEPLDSAILFAPVGDIVPAALRNLDRGGTLAIAGIYLTDIPALNYERELFQERTLRSVTSNTRGDAEEFLRLAERLRLKVSVTPYPLEQAGQALTDLAEDKITGAAVLTVA
jgi:propanol-preferring alcohol dehydrogenase